MLDLQKDYMQKVKKMNDKVYILRRKVIGFIHEAKKLYPKLPRITVRICENDKKIAGWGGMGRNIIWITEDYVASRGLVFHEILHAVFAQDHVKGCPLMSGTGTSIALSDSEADQLFMKYVLLNKGNYTIGEKIQSYEKALMLNLPRNVLSRSKLM